MGCSDYKILLIEDDQHVAQLLMSVIEFVGLSSDHAHCSRTAFHYLGNSEYNLAIIDINLGFENGLDIACEIRKRRPDIDLITMTGGSLESIESQVQKLDVLFHLNKPISIRELKNTLNKVVKRKETLS